MTAGTLDSRTTADTTPRPKTYPVEKPKFPLVWKLFGLTALLIAGVVGLAVGIEITHPHETPFEADVADDLRRQQLRPVQQIHRQEPIGAAEQHVGPGIAVEVSGSYQAPLRSHVA